MPRHRSLDGAFNLSDFGGLRAGSGLRVRPGVLFRSDVAKPSRPGTSPT
jgi:hypothetical protein